MDTNDLHLEINKTVYFHLKQGNITITHTFMLHFCTFNVKIIKNQLLLLVYFHRQNSND